MKKIIIIGAGMAGIGAAYRFYCNNIRAAVFEKTSFPGGSAASFQTKDDFIFDYVPYSSFTKMERIRKLFQNSANEKAESVHYHVNSYWKGYWIKHPVQINLCGLPNELIARILKEFFEADPKNEKQAVNFKDWLYSVFGRTFTDTFPAKYFEKFCTIPIDNIDISENKPKFYHPTFDEILAGAISNEPKDTQYNTDIYYPSRGVINSFVDEIKLNVTFKYEHRIKLIDAKKKFIVFENGKFEKYDYLISTMPLPELVKRIIGAPYKIQMASDKLAYTSCIVVNLVINRKNLSKAYQTYFYDQNIIFSKLTFPGLLSQNNTTEEGESIQAEMYFSKKYKPLHLKPESFIEPTIFSLQRCGILKKEDKIIFKEAIFIPYADIIFDFDRKTNLSVIHNYLDGIGIKFCGRYGDWDSKTADEAFTSGENAAQKIINQMNSNSIKNGVSKEHSRFLGNEFDNIKQQ